MDSFEFRAEQAGGDHVKFTITPPGKQDYEAFCFIVTAAEAVALAHALLTPAVHIVKVQEMYVDRCTSGAAD